MKKRGNSHSEFLFNKKILNSKRSNSHSEFLFNKKILNSKRSQSEIITTVLIIILILGAIVIVWNIVKSSVKTSTESIFVGQFAIDLKISSVYITGDGKTAYVSVERGVGKGDVSALYFIFTGSSYTYKYPLSEEIPGELGNRVYNISVDAVKSQNPDLINFSSIKSVSLAFELTSSGKTVTTPVQSEFKKDLRSDIDLPNNPNCCALPYFEAGICYGTDTNCGVYPDCISCNSKDTCIGTSLGCNFNTIFPRFSSEL